ncbi:MAG: hypothetical protein ABWJ42_00430 [Sulfolobales archaeon]
MKSRKDDKDKKNNRGAKKETRREDLCIDAHCVLEYIIPQSSLDQ